MGPVLEIQGLSIAFADSRVVDAVSLEVRAREIVAVIGESGSGKTVTALAVLGLLPRQAVIQKGRIALNGRPLLELSATERRAILGDRLAYIPQNAMGALNPTLKVGMQVGEPLVLHRQSAWREALGAAVELLRSVHLQSPELRAAEYPHQFSGGMQQRAMIAMGLALEPELLIADEPTTALDVTVQAQVIRLLRDIRDEHGTSILFITHDLGLVAGLCDRVYVMYAGHVVEQGPVDAIFDHPRHPYTRALLAATPSAAERQEELVSIPGQIPSPGERPEGCVFAPRCARASPQCASAPELSDLGPDHRLRCWHPEPAA